MKSFAWAEFLARLCGVKIRLVHPVNPFEMSYLFTKKQFHNRDGIFIWYNLLNFLM